MIEVKNYIDGHWVDSGGLTFESVIQRPVKHWRALRSVILRR